ncbi:MAG: purine-binding chemotaxis protein CheW [Deltaproteobacteria bacterium]|nr:purine-binding chemotaxis protein CheW [Deltaproteobacteria bacterium]
MKTVASTERATTATVDLACFELAGQTYAVAIAHVREILVTPAVTRLPDSPPVVEGVIDLRGMLIPVVDLARLLVRDDRPTGPRARTFVVAVRDFIVGFRVERATRVVAVPVSSLEPVPELARELGCRVVAAAFRRSDQDPILVIDLEVLVDRVLGESTVRPRGEGVAA